MSDYLVILNLELWLHLGRKILMASASMQALGPLVYEPFLVTF